MKWKIFLILFSVCALWPQKTSVFACGFSSDEEELRYMLFNPDLTEKKVWWNYFYNRQYNYLYGETRVENDEDELAKEWRDNIGSKASLDVVRACIFDVLTDSALEKNSFYTEMNGHASARRYFEAARRSQDVSILSTSWEEQGVVEQRDQERIKLITSLNELLSAENDAFFKRKYAFQLIKLSFYNKDWLTLEKMYDQYFASSKRDVLYWWATHYKSMKLEHEEKLDSANYLHALVFSKSTNKMLPSKEFFSRKNLDGVLALARDDKERADVYLLAAIINPGRALEGIKRVHQFNRYHKHLGLLITREINKLEDWLGSGKYSYSEAALENYQSDVEYLREVIAFLSTIDIDEPVLYHFSMACLYLMNDDSEPAKKHLDLIESNDEDDQYQQTVLRTVLIAQSKDVRRSDVQDEIGKQYEYLLSNRAMKFESQKILYSLSSYLRNRFAEKGLISVAGLFDNYAQNKFCYSCHNNSFEYSMVAYWDQNASPADVEQLISLYNKPQKNTLESILFKPYSNPNYFYDLLSVKHLREGRAEEALVPLQKIPDSFWHSFKNANENLDKDPFQNNESLFDVPTMDIYSKREIVERIIALEKEATNDPSKRAKNYMQLGNAWYNFTQHSWFMISYGWSSGSITDPQHMPLVEKKALSYYKRALEYEKSDENRAKIVYMIATTSYDKEQKRYAREYEQYADTQFYQKRNCLTLKDLALQ